MKKKGQKKPDGQEKLQNEGWGSAVIPRLAKDIRNELPETKGFSERNIGRMIAFYREYSATLQILPQALAKLEFGILVCPPIVLFSFFTAPAIDFPLDFS